MSYIVNSRVLSGRVTGVQRYLSELLAQTQNAELLAPRFFAQGQLGHLWEQCVLPARVRGRTLWSPSNTGPLACSQQVLTVHDFATLDNPEWFSKKFSAWYGYLLPRLLPRVAAIITPSAFTKQRILDRVQLPESKIIVIPNGVSSRFCPEARDRSSIDNIYPDLIGKRYVLAVGSVEPRKNLKRCLSAWSRIHKSLPDDIVLCVVGAKDGGRIFGDAGISLEQRNVVYLGHVPDHLLPNIYASSVCSVYLSVYEGFGLPPLESMACGTPVITSNVGALAEVSSGAALTVDPYDEAEIEYSMTKLICSQTLQAELRFKGLSKATEFNWERSAKLTFDVIAGF